MDESELARRKALTFEQAEGLAELPRQLQRDEMPDAMRATLLAVIVSHVDAEMHRVRHQVDVGPEWAAIFGRLLVEHMAFVVINIPKGRDKILSLVAKGFSEGPATQVYGLLQALVRIANDRAFSSAIAVTLEKIHSAYRLIDGDTLMPVGSPEEARTVEVALAATRETGLAGSHKHLRQAAAALSEGQFADSVRESIHAMESVLRSLTGEPSVSKALTALGKRRELHEAFKRGIAQLYGYGSDEPGVRHPLLDKGDAAVTEEDALLMLGMCSALVTYFARSFGDRH